MTRSDKRTFHFIYKTTCLITGRFYIGMHSTDDMEDGYMGSGQMLRFSIKKHGEQNHRYEVIEMLSDRAALSFREKQLVNEETLKDPLCMNLCKGGEGGPTRVGMKHSKETRRKISLGLQGHTSSDKVREQAKVMGLAAKGRVLSKETKEKLSKVKKGRPSPLKGKKRSVEIGQKISKALKLRNELFPRSKKAKPEKVSIQEVKKKLSEAGKKAWADPEKRKKILDARKDEVDERKLVFYCDDARHLVCIPYSVGNLRRAAKELNVKRCWYHHSTSGLHHYDIPKRRITEIQAKCKVVSPRIILAICKGTVSDVSF